MVGESCPGTSRDRYRAGLAQAPALASVQPSGNASDRAAAQVPYMSMTVEGAGQSRARQRFNASPPRRRACVRDQSFDDGSLP